MILNKCGLMLAFTSLAIATFSLRRPGWLDRVVQYHKNKLFEDLQLVPSVQIKATLQPAPPGYVDSTEWDYASVVRLLTLIRQSEAARPVRRALRRMFASRRMSFQESLVAFPSLSKDHVNDFYYHMDSGEYYGDILSEQSFADDESVIVVTNPVESRLPSAMISTNLLREILESRAKAARQMPTTKKTIPWIPMNKTTAAAGNTTQTDSSGATGGGETKDATGGTGATGDTGAPATTEAAPAEK